MTKKPKIKPFWKSKTYQGLALIIASQLIHAYNLDVALFLGGLGWSLYGRHKADSAIDFYNQKLNGLFK